MSDERILEVVENQDKYYILGFIKSLKANIDELQQENQQLKIQISAREEEYIKLENNWNELKDFLENNWKETQDIWFVKIINKMNELERGVSDVED